MEVNSWKSVCQQHFNASANREFCDIESQSFSHLYQGCNLTQKLIACFEKQFEFDNKLTELEKLMGTKPSQNRPKLIMKKLSILRRMIYQYNQRGEKPRWGQFLELIENFFNFSRSSRNTILLCNAQFFKVEIISLRNAWGVKSQSGKVYQKLSYALM